MSLKLGTTDISGVPTTLINTVNGLASDMVGKADTDLSNCTKPYVTETYHNGSSWYRLWSDGWCEQGGSATGDGKSGRTVSLLKTYSDTNYNIQAEITDYTSSSQKIVSIGSKTASDFKAYTSTTSGWGSYAFDWTACGYIN